MTDSIEKDPALRPADWDSYIGQKKMKERLQVSINAATSRGELISHVLLVGPPGAGKTSLASLIAQESMEEFHEFVMPVKVKALQKHFLEKPGVTFLDEIHRSPRKDQEFLLRVVEDGQIPFDNGQMIPIPHNFTVVAATTELPKVIRPLRDRFTFKPRFEPYSDDEMAKIITNMAERLDLRLPKPHALALGRASAGTPRQARNLIMTARDLGTTDPKKVLDMAGVTDDGLTEDHVAYLKALHRLDDVAGVDKMSNLLGQPKDVISELEQLLLNRDYIDYTQRGRQLNLKGMQLVKDHK